MNLTQYLGLGTAILSGILQRLLEKNNWVEGNWIDDILIRDIKILDNKISLIGNVIYGKSDTTKEWIFPLLFQFYLNDNWTDFYNYQVCFDRRDGELNYLDYHKNNIKWNSYFNEKF